MEYCHTKKEGEKYALAQAEGLNVSFKDLVEVCRNILGRNAESALSYLDGVSEGTVAVRYHAHNKKLGHRHELHGQKGRYPRRAAKAAHSVLENAIANARALGFSNPKIHHACANKGDIYPRGAPKGRRARSDYETANLQIALRDARGGNAGVATQPQAQKPEAKSLPQQKPEAKAQEQKQASQTQIPQAQKQTTNAQAAKPAATTAQTTQPQVQKQSSQPVKLPKPPAIHVTDPLGSKKSLSRKNGEKKEA